MEKHAVLLIAHQNPTHLIDLINYLGEEFEFYIHYNKKSNIVNQDLEILNSLKNVKFFSRKYKVNWGGVKLTKIILYLGKEAIKNEDYKYILVLSGQDLPVKPKQHILDFYRKNNGKEFLENFALPAKWWSEEGGFERFNHFYLYDFINGRNKLGFKVINGLVKAQKLLKVNRKIENKLPPLYGGSCWFSLTRECFKYCLSYIENNPKIMDSIEFTFAPDEILFQTIVMNSDFREMVINNNQYFILWTTDSSPLTLEMNHYSEIINSDKLFARKFEFPISSELKNKLLLKNSPK
jgi:hypothetical protein